MLKDAPGSVFRSRHIRGGDSGSVDYLASAGSRMTGTDEAGNHAAVNEQDGLALAPNLILQLATFSPELVSSLRRAAGRPVRML